MRKCVCQGLASLPPYEVSFNFPKCPPPTRFKPTEIQSQIHSFAVDGQHGISYKLVFEPENPGVLPWHKLTFSADVGQFGKIGSKWRCQQPNIFSGITTVSKKASSVRILTLLTSLARHLLGGIGRGSGGRWDSIIVRNSLKALESALAESCWNCRIWKVLENAWLARNNGGSKLLKGG
ncbi:hypothetical protein CEXT_171821 [Caerostris extrusa]|uniref:Uncharacterized protein n=1 Tax=Caerostris extrusa TaxID=172846 RepID=A0AAV4V4Z0_CAEEX|nr:hypothetical protein CEXT_171821 [Caerostris extrusa]